MSTYISRNNDTGNFDVKQKTNTQHALEVLRANGKSFHFAKLFLGKDTGIAAARLYRFCRYCDDIADESKNKYAAVQRLSKILADIYTGVSSIPEVQDFLSLCHHYNIDKRLVKHLIDGLLQDQKEVAIETEQELIEYSFRVAGIVGLLMSPILGANQQGAKFAIDLGIAMQLTNIARDIQEDAKMNRRYIPGQWIGDMKPKNLAAPTSDEQVIIRRATKRLLDLAENYYKSGFDGLYHLSGRSRIAICIAGRVYRAIGFVIKENNYNSWQQRAFVPLHKKLLVSSRCIFTLLSIGAKSTAPNHNDGLHWPLKYLQFDNAK